MDVGTSIAPPPPVASDQECGSEYTMNSLLGRVENILGNKSGHLDTKHL